MRRFRIFVWLLAAALWNAALVADPPQRRDRGEQVVSRVDEIFGKVSDILGLKIRRPVPRAVISRDRIRQYVEQRMKETLKAEDIHAQETVLKKFGFVPQDFDLKAQTLDLLTEQAAAFYDFKSKKLYVADWAAKSMEDIAVVHELAHALADQHFNLEKFINKSGNDDDADTARGSVVEGQASWVMTEYMMRQMGRSLKDSPELAKTAVESTAGSAKDFPVFSKEPLYIRETMLFPYTQGMLFQQAVFERMGRDAFAEVFRRPPQTSQQVMHAEQYFSRAAATRPALPPVSLPGYKKLGEGTIGELDHQILLEQFLGKAEARDLAPRWRGGRYALWENKKENRDVLVYAVEWANAEDAAHYFADYRKAAAKKWKRLEATSESPEQVAGTGDDGRFQWTLRGAVFTSVEGLP